jgi:hypothetical protein
MITYHKRIWLFGLLVNCPMGNEHKQCPFKKLRREPATKKINIAYDIPDEELSKMIKYHKKCLLKREANTIKYQFAKASLKNQKADYS